MAISDPTTKSPNDLLPSPVADEPLLRATLARAGTPEAAALTLLGAVMKAEDAAKPTRRYLLDAYAECLLAVCATGRPRRAEKGAQLAPPVAGGQQPQDTSRDTRGDLESALGDVDQESIEYLALRLQGFAILAALTESV